MIPANLFAFCVLLCYPQIIGAVHQLTVAYLHGGFHTASFFSANGAAPQMAIERAEADGLMTGFNIRLVYGDDKCLPHLAISLGMQFMDDYNVDAFIGLTCTVGSHHLATLATYFNLPMFADASTGQAVDDKSIYKTFVRFMPSYNKFGLAIRELVIMYRWKRFAVVGDNTFLCQFTIQAFTKVAGEEGWLIVDWLRYPKGLPDAALDSILTSIQQIARIVILCGAFDDVDKFLVRADERGLAAPDYLYIVSPYEPISTFNPTLIGARGNESRVAQKAASSSIQFSMPYDPSNSFNWEHKRRLAGPPWNIPNPETSPLAFYLYDSVLMYIHTVNQTLEQGLDPRNGTHLFHLATQTTFDGLSGRVVLDENADRLPMYMLKSTREGWDTALTFGHIVTSNPPGQMMIVLDIRMWDPYGGRPPRDTPACGFFNEFCQKPDPPTMEICLGVGALLLAIIVVGIVYLRRRQKMLEIKKMRWNIRMDEITFIQEGNTRHSTPNIPLAVSTISGMNSISTIDSNILTSVGIYCGVKVAVKSTETVVLNPTYRDNLELKAIRDLQHDNVNQFFGLCVTPGNVRVVSAYCQKGSLQSILMTKEMTMDEVFKDSLVHDLLGGLKYIHSSSVSSHGKLKSSNCLVDARWMLKIADIDPSCVSRRLPDRLPDEDRCRELLWTAPELLRQKVMPMRGTKAGDVYSFSIVLHEICSCCDAFYLKETGRSAKDVVTSVKTQSLSNRPNIKDREEIPTDYKQLMTACWSETPEDRPSVDAIIKMMKDANRKRQNLVDVVLMKLEKYSQNLENSVMKRTEQLMKMKKKTENLLHQMLPKSVADELIIGRAVQPTIYDNVTIFFSDVTNFVRICTNTTPVASVTLLNDLYELMDNCVAKFNVYKVETINDTYMVSSGVPNPNPNHACDVADMALTLLDLVLRYEVKGTDEGHLQLRIGIHSGRCCAGVVGMSMPRYCLFGDTVNTASRMCSHGQHSRIHVSDSTSDILAKSSNTLYQLCPRDPMHIKGKGMMSTFWLSGKKHHVRIKSPV